MSVSVQVLETSSSRFDYTGLPNVTREWIREKGWKFIWVSTDHRMTMKYRHLGFRPLLWKDIDKDEVKDDLLGVVLDSDVSKGEIRRSDCILMVRSASEEEFWNIEARVRSNALLGSTPLAIQDAINERGKAAGLSSSIRIIDSENDAGSHVHGAGSARQFADDPELAAKVREQLNTLNP